MNNAEFLPLHQVPLHYNISFTQQGDSQNRSIFKDGVLIAIDIFQSQGKKSFMTARNELNTDQSLVRFVGLDFMSNEVAESITYKNNAKHGVHYFKEYGNNYFWEDELVSRPVYWFKKNYEDLKTFNPKKIWNALFKPNEMTRQELA